MLAASFLLALFLNPDYLGAAEQPATESTHESVVPPAPEGFVLNGNAERGARLYSDVCVLCHGTKGDGKGRLKIDPPVRDLRDRERMDKRTDWEIYLVIRDGAQVLGLSEKMFGWGSTLSDREIRDLAAYVRVLSAPTAKKD